MAAPDTLWAVTSIAHPALLDVRDNCTECLALTSSAISTAKVTGSVGATESLVKTDGTEHSVTVSRAINVVVRPGDPDQPDRTFTVAELTIERGMTELPGEDVEW